MKNKDYILLLLLWHVIIQFISLWIQIGILMTL